MRHKGFNQFGNVVENEAQDYHARIIQHENDHLDGTIFLDRVENTQLLKSGKIIIKQPVIICHLVYLADQHIIIIRQLNI